MKTIILALLLTVPVFHTPAQKNGKEKSVDKEEIKKEEVRRMIQNRNFVFNATEMLPRGLGVINLGYDFDVQVKDGILVSFLPFMGKTYYTNIGGNNSGFDFTEEIESLKIRTKKKGYKVDIDVNNEADQLNFTFHIMHSGFATLTLASSKRQSISYLGTIDRVK